MFGIKRNATDKVFSDYVRMKADYICEHCKRDFKENLQGIHVSHYVGRGNKSVRWNEDNVTVACFSCHRRLSENPHRHTEYMIKKLGQKKYDELIRSSHLTFKEQHMDEDLIKLGYKMAIKELRGKIIGAR